MLGTVAKAGQVLDLFVEERSDWGVTEVARVLDVPKSCAHSMLTTLATIGLLERTAEKRYRLGWHVLALSRTLLDTTELRRAAGPVGVRLAATSRGVAQLAVLERRRALCIEVYGRKLDHRLGVTKVGEYIQSSHPITKVLLAPADAPGGSVDSDDDMAKVAARGYASVVDECLDGVCCVAAVIRAHDGTAAAALGLSVPRARFAERHSRSAVLASAQLVSRTLATSQLALMS